jgi:hypothetical protein
MTIAEVAAAVFNAFRHHGHIGWFPWQTKVLGTNQYEAFDSFEAQAIATAYLALPAAAPPQPSVVSITVVSTTTFSFFERVFMANVYSVQASAVDPAVVASRSLSVVINNAAPLVGTLDAGFTCAIGDTGTLTLTDMGVDGVASAPSDPFPFTAAAAATGPDKPTILGITLVSSS